MNVRTTKLLAIVLMAAATVFASCSKDEAETNQTTDPVYDNIEAKIAGKWKTATINDMPVYTNNKTVTTYYNDKTATISFVNNNGWDNKKPFTWSIEGTTVCDKLVDAGMTQYKNTVMIDDSMYSYIYNIYTKAGGESVEKTLDLNVVAQKVSVDYSQDIIGLWEGTEMTGQETYGDANHRILYKADGTYSYLSLVEEQWVKQNALNEWYIDGDWLAMRWQDNGGDVMNYECWDIDYIKDGVMKWSAFRKDTITSESFHTTFTWKKIDTPTTNAF